MRIVGAACFILGLLSLGCVQPDGQPQPPRISFTEQDVNLVIAKRVTKDLGPTGINDRPLFDGKIFAFATFHWNDLTTPAGDQELEFRWYSGEKWVSSFRKTYRFTAAPYYAWVSTNVTNIGLGKGRVEVYCQGKRLAVKTFELVESRWNPAPARP
jgi:hypothetical protein